MDPFSPINGISLERYAELGAEVSDHVNDPDACAKIVEQHGVSRADWEAASAGWIARMKDMSLMGRVAIAYMPMYNAALAKKKGTVDVSFEDFCTLAGARAALGGERFNATYQLDDSSWTLIASAWTMQRMPQDPMRYQMYGTMVEQEMMRIQQGGAPKPVNIVRSAGGSGVVAPTAVAPAQPQGPMNAQQVENQMMAQAVQANVAQHMQYAQQQSANAYAGVQQNVGFLGGAALNAFGMGAIAQGFGPGMAVLVQWNDGNKYPATIAQVGGGQICVAFGDGRQMWVPESAVSRRQ